MVSLKKRKKTKNDKFPKFIKKKPSLLHKITKKQRHFIMVEMNYLNGTVDHFIIPRKGHTFKLHKNVYVIDETAKVWCNSSKEYMFRYHEAYSLPYHNKIGSEELHEAQHNTMPEVETSANPTVLAEVIKMEYAKGVVAGGEITPALNRVLITVIIVGMIALVHLIATAFTQGWLS